MRKAFGYAHDHSLVVVDENEQFLLNDWILQGVGYATNYLAFKEHPSRSHSTLHLQATNIVYNRVHIRVQTNDSIPFYLVILILSTK